jgi:hypothetical protein
MANLPSNDLDSRTFEFLTATLDELKQGGFEEVQLFALQNEKVYVIGHGDKKVRTRAVSEWVIQTLETMPDIINKPLQPTPE